MAWSIATHAKSLLVQSTVYSKGTDQSYIHTWGLTFCISKASLRATVSYQFVWPLHHLFPRQVPSISGMWSHQVGNKFDKIIIIIIKFYINNWTIIRKEINSLVIHHYTGHVSVNTKPHRENGYQIRRHIYAVLATKRGQTRKTARTYAAPSTYRVETIFDGPRRRHRQDIPSVPLS